MAYSCIVWSLINYFILFSYLRKEQKSANEAEQLLRQSPGGSWAYDRDLTCKYAATCQGRKYGLLRLSNWVRLQVIRKRL